ncbi:hypothetical protein [Aminiphilus circumscriptus]|uniref:hypothetical protein n=1 Tax=Aminiphilus circumscriptus TaxID=290732 RepID=UPI000478551A|nr:hypothetical protein [Aminiphilus circumscriptus]
MTTPTFPFEATPEELLQNPESYVDAVFSCLESEFLVMPKGTGFITYPVFSEGYEALKSATSGFRNFSTEKVLSAVLRIPLAFLVLRTMLGFTPPEWGYVTSQRTGVSTPQGFIRTLDRKIRMRPTEPLNLSEGTSARIEALVETACRLIETGAPDVDGEHLHRLDKADTKHGAESVGTLADLGAPYAMLLYERFLGRPFAGHRDSVSELVGDGLESAIEGVLTAKGISFRKTKRAERLPGFDQTPDFVIPDEFAPKVVIEAKITEDDGTARDKVTRIQHLGELSILGRDPNDPKFEVIACIGGRGFGVRREDMKKMLLATRGKVFTLKTLDRLVTHTRLREYRTK